ncbi:hypothetical protein ABTZ93_11080 [Streptomyces sp. NPDC097941]|uniref:hypothetical protein n=1 Tax=Streptomyces sp. NPDC097941 TaxID=3155685 RepID=UPI00331E68BE
MMYLRGDLAGPGREETEVIEAACEASGVTFLCPDPGVLGPEPRSIAVATAVVTTLFDEHAETYAFARGSGVQVLLAALAAWLRQHPNHLSPVAAMVLCAPPLEGFAEPSGDLSALRVPTLVVTEAGDRARAAAEALQHRLPCAILVEEPFTRHGCVGASAAHLARAATWERATAFFSDASGTAFGQVRGPELEVGFHETRDLRFLPDVAAEAADVLVSAYGRLSHSRDTHIRRMVDHPGTLVWARSAGLLVGCSHIRADGKWGACGMVPEYRGYGIGFRLARLGLRQMQNQFVEVGRNTPHGLRLVLGCGFHPLHDESAVRTLLRSAVRREIEPLGVDALGFVYRRKREGGRDTGPLRLCLHRPSVRGRASVGAFARVGLPAGPPPDQLVPPQPHQGSG